MLHCHNMGVMEESMNERTAGYLIAAEVSGLFWIAAAVAAWNLF